MTLTLADRKRASEKIGPPPPPMPRIAETPYAPNKHFILWLGDTIYVGSLEWFGLVIRRENAARALAVRFGVQAP